MLLLADITILANRFFPFEIKILGYWFVPMGVILTSISWLRYKNFRPSEDASDWENEGSKQRIIKGYLIVVFMILILLPIIF